MIRRNGFFMFGMLHLVWFQCFGQLPNIHFIQVGCFGEMICDTISVPKNGMTIKSAVSKSLFTTTLNEIGCHGQKVKNPESLKIPFIYSRTREYTDDRIVELVLNHGGVNVNHEVLIKPCLIKLDPMCYRTLDTNVISINSLPKACTQGISNIVFRQTGTTMRIRIWNTESELVFDSSYSTIDTDFSNYREISLANLSLGNSIEILIQVSSGMASWYFQSR